MTQAQFEHPHQVNPVGMNAEQAALMGQLANEQGGQYAAPVSRPMAEALRGLDEVPGLSTKKLEEPGAETTFRPVSMMDTDSTSYPIDGILQSPIAIIRTGGEDKDGNPAGDDYVILDATQTSTLKRAYLVARFNETLADQPTVVGSLTEDGMVIGRLPQYGNATGTQTSRMHATLKLDAEGAINIVNHGVNGTEVTVPRGAEVSPDAQTIVMGGFRDHVSREEAAHNPITYKAAARAKTEEVLPHLIPYVPYR